MGGGLGGAGGVGGVGGPLVRVEGTLGEGGIGLDG